jgi:hypothetical protein
VSRVVGDSNIHRIGELVRAALVSKFVIAPPLDASS